MEEPITTNTLYAVSTGPAGSRYLTRQAVETSGKCRTILYPVTASASNPSIAFECIRQAVDVSGKKCIGLPFSMTRDTARTESEYANAVSQIEAALRHGDAALVAIGDVSVYSSAARIASMASERGLRTEFVAGVPSFCAAAAALKIDLAESDEEIRIIPGDAYYKSGRIESALASSGTKIIMKSARHLADIINIMEEKHLIDRASLVHKAGYDDERVFRKQELLALPQDLVSHAYMSIIILQ